MTGWRALLAVRKARFTSNSVAQASNAVEKLAIARERDIEVDRAGELF
jgi:hypothetical protein